MEIDGVFRCGHSLAENPLTGNKPWLMLGDCLERMAEIPDGSVDMIACDLPYGTTACKWDTVIPFEPLWAHYRRVIKGNGAIVLTASQPFTSSLVMSNSKWFKYEWIWAKSRPTGHIHAKNKPMKSHENVLVFSPGTAVHASQSKNRMVYNPQGLKTLASPVLRKNSTPSDAVISFRKSHRDTIQISGGYPHTLLPFASAGNQIHQTQKPVPLFEYLIRTYTNPGEIVLDNCFGSGTTGVACVNTGRRFIGIEKDERYFSIGQSRIAAAGGD